MSRIRSIKPEWLEDEALLRAGSDARVLSVALILLADDYGRGRYIPEALAGQVFPFSEDSSRAFREAVWRLYEPGFLKLYEVREQHYFEVANWAKHQKVDKPGRPRVPPPDPNNYYVLESSPPSRESYRASRQSLAPDRDLDHDHDHDLDLDADRARTRESETSAAAQSFESEDPVRVAAVRCRQWLAQIFKRDDYDHRGKWAHALSELWSKPEDEKAAAATTLAQEVERPNTRRILTPQHILDYWQAYASGEPPRSRGHRTPDAEPKTETTYPYDYLP